MNNRLRYIDCSRGIAILLVIFGHSMIKDFTIHNRLIYYLRYFIYTIHMPLFFIISGFLFEKNLKKYINTKKINYVIDKFLKFMIPYFAFSIINYFIVFIGLKIEPLAKILINQNYVLNSIGISIFSIFTYIGHIDSHLWFLYVMFFVLLVNRLLFAKDYNSRNSLTLFIGFFLFYYLSFKISKYLPEIIWKTMKYNLIFYVGRLSFKYFSNNKDINKYLLLILSILSTFLLFVVSKQNLIYPVLKFIAEISCSIVIIFYLSPILYNSKLLNYIGCNQTSMALYLLHMPFILPVIVFVFDKVCINIFLNIVLSTILTLLICIFIYKIIVKISILDKILFGKLKYKS